MNVSMIFQGWGEKVLGPLLIIIGLFMLGIIKINFPGFSRLTEKIGESGEIDLYYAEHKQIGRAHV